MPRYTKALLQELLDHAYYAHNRAGAISEQNLDPLLVVYENSHRANLPAIALVCALFAYGSVGAIVGFLRKLDFSLLGGDSVLGEQCGSFALCGKGTTTKVANLYHKVQSSHSPTAMPRILEEENCVEREKSCLEQTSLESTFEQSSHSPTAKRSFFRKQATAVQGEAAAGFFRNPRILEEENQAFKSLRGDTIAQAFHTNARKLDSSMKVDSIDCRAIATALARNDRKNAEILNNLQAQANLDSSKSHSDSKILDEKCGLQGKSQGSYLDGDLCDFSSLPHLSRKAESFRLENILHTTFPYYRFQTSDDVKLLFASLACIIAQGGLESTFAHKSAPLAIINAISQAICSHASRILASPLYAPFFSHDYCARFLASKQFSQGFSFLVGFSPSSPLKRWNMFLRWLTRKDHIDLGLWQDLLSPSDLLLPLDTHTLRISRALTLLQRKSYDRKAVLEVSAALKRFCAHDPIRYDFALYRIGQSGAWLKQLES